jgi:hypothetical protein
MTAVTRVAGQEFERNDQQDEKGHLNPVNPV